MGFLNSERKNFIFYLLKRPTELFLFFPKFISIAFHYFIRKMSKLETIKQITKTANNASKRTTAPSRDDKYCTAGMKMNFSKLPEIQFTPCENSELLPIRLASETISAQPDVDWGHIYHDIENTFALNRFAWLLTSLIERPSANMAEYALHSLVSWINVMGEKTDHPAWESYSVAERLSNWPFILIIVKKIVSLPDNVLSTIEKAMQAHIEYLLSHLELRGELTNNHVLNDARGLYIAGIMLDHQHAVKKAKAVFTEWTEKLVDTDGMLREHSSHYQYLLCQRYEQVYFLSNNIEDPAFHLFIKKWLELMLQSCEFFSLYSQNSNPSIPLMGDISPDVTPRWLLPCADHGWAKFKKWLGWEPLILNKRSEEKALKTGNGKFLRYDTGDITVFWHIETDGPVFPNHRHFDIGSFVLFKKGKQVIADPGRFSYTSEGSFGKGAKAHSSILIDSLGAYCEDVRLNLLKAYSCQNATYTIVESGNRFIVEIDVNGFQRLQTPVKWKRSFAIEEGKMLITDVLDSVETNYVETRFQIAPPFDVKQSNGELDILADKSVFVKLITDHSPADCFGLSCGDGPNVEKGWFSEEYGSRSSGTTILFQQELHNSQTWSYEVRW